MSSGATLRRVFDAAARLLPRRKLRRPLDVAPDMSRHRFLFIGGLHRSGTSVLHRLLSEHPDVSGFSGTGAKEDEGQHLQTVFPPARRFGGPGRFAFDPAASLTDPSLASAESRDRLLREWGAYYDLTKRVLLEKSPPNLIRSRYFRTLFPGSRFVFIVRHPICVALATQKWSRAALPELLLHWVMAHRRMVADCAGADDVIVLRYEEFAGEPQVFLEGIADHAGIGAFRSSATVSDRNADYLDRWSNECGSVAELVTTAMPELAPAIEAFGYALEPPFVRAIPESQVPWLRQPRTAR